MQTIIVEAAVIENTQTGAVDVMPLTWVDVGENFIQTNEVVAFSADPLVPPLVFTFCLN